MTDTGLNPFLSTTQAYHWSVAQGPLVFATDAALPTYIFNRFDVVNLVVAGGKPPYRCEVSTPPPPRRSPTASPSRNDSTQIIGAPVGVKPAAPFVYNVTVRAIDSTPVLPLTVDKVFVITVLVPDVVITTTSVANGVCGQPYTSKINTIDGIAPFLYTIVDATGSSAKLVGEPGTPGGTAKVGHSPHVLGVRPGQRVDSLDGQVSRGPLHP